MTTLVNFARSTCKPPPTIECHVDAEVDRRCQAPGDDEAQHVPRQVQMLVRRGHRFWGFHWGRVYIGAAGFWAIARCSV